MRRAAAVLAGNEAGLLLVILVFGGIFAALSPGFTSPFNLYALSRVVAINTVIGLGMMVVIVTGGLIGSSLIGIFATEGPMLFGVHFLSVLGFLGSIVLGIWLLLGVLRSGRL